MSHLKSPASPARRRVRAHPAAVPVRPAVADASTVLEDSDRDRRIGPDDDEEPGLHETCESARSDGVAVAEEAVASDDAVPDMERDIGHGDSVDVETEAPADGRPSEPLRDG